ncbi:DUF2919 domain-containing protein [Erwinia sp. HR93]|uniref:DUF2919 domain-containing protein n=1 Tax=Erwinia sp. HR93 TaxID=3094840 RepID=UPI002ADEC379|nr:DUF2919 domain-containing protein [Erwinia sp. HR93]MEA1065632.1 DUF2919 domain-containing protein [Erwinia sp. HR93]
MQQVMWLPSDFDSRGGLKLPPGFWCVLLLQARTWVLFVLAGASRQQGAELLALFYPDRQAFGWGLLAGLPAVIAFLLSGRRGRFPRLWQGWRWVLIVTQFILLCWQGAWLSDDNASLQVAALLAADALALGWLLTSRRLRACFLPDG